MQRIWYNLLKNWIIINPDWFSCTLVQHPVWSTGPRRLKWLQLSRGADWSAAKRGFSGTGSQTVLVGRGAVPCALRKPPQKGHVAHGAASKSTPVFCFALPATLISKY